MSRADFEERLQRIGGSAPHHAAMEPNAQGPSPSGRPKMNHGLFFLACLLMMSGVQAVKYANQNYEALRDSGALLMIAALALGGIAAMVVGCVIGVRALPKNNAKATEAPTKPEREPSARAQVIFSLLGFLFGAIASFYMFISSAAQYAGAEKDMVIALGGLVIAAGLAILSLIFGLTSLFLRGYGLGRVPFYFLMGGIAVYAFVRIARINMLDVYYVMAMQL